MVSTPFVLSFSEKTLVRQMLRDNDPLSSLFLRAKYWQVIIAKGQSVRSIRAPSGRTTLETGFKLDHCQVSAESPG